MTPKVSIIVPIYNAGKFLEKCLDTLVNQTLKDIEIILIDDGSTDDSLNVIKNYAKKYNNIKYTSKENEGQAIARNIGIQMSSGEFITFIDSDDYIEENYIEKMILNTDESTLTMCGYFIETSMENGDFFSRKVTYKEKEIISIKEHLANLFHQ